MWPVQENILPGKEKGFFFGLFLKFSLSSSNCQSLWFRLIRFDLRQVSEGNSLTILILKDTLNFQGLDTPNFRQLFISNKKIAKFDCWSVKFQDSRILYPESWKSCISDSKNGSQGFVKWRQCVLQIRGKLYPNCRSL